MPVLEDIILNGFIKPVGVINGEKKLIKANRKLKEVLSLPDDYFEKYVFELIEDEGLGIKLTEPVFLRDEEIEIKSDASTSKYLLQMDTLKLSEKKGSYRIIILDDITELKRKENILLGKLEKMICRVIQPLTEASGYFELAHAGKNYSNTFHGEIKRSFMELTRMLDQLQCFVYLLQGDFHLNKKFVQPGEIVSEFLETVTLPDALSVETFFEEPLPALECDVPKIQQVLYIILDNAIRFSPGDGKISISVTDKETFVEFSVRDEGEGIPARVLKRIFNDLYNDFRSPEEEVMHLGIGLPLAKKIIHAHGGLLWIETEPGKGTNVKIALLKS